MDKMLTHHGIKGMKWGVRRYQNKDGSLTPAGKKRYSDDANSVIKNMTDAELRDRINRLQLERQYKSLLTTEGQTEINKGKAFVADILKTSGKNMGVQLTNYAIGTFLNTYIGKGKKIVNPKSK